MMRLSFGWFAFGLTLTLAACSGGEDNTSKSCNTGDEGCDCFPNSTCNGALSCASHKCVRLASAGASGAQPGGLAGQPAPKNEAGSAGRGGAAGSVDTPLPYSGAGTSGSSACVPKCGTQKCGLDPVCQMSCGTCDPGLQCSAGACISPQPLKVNGATCSVSTECASGVCAKNSVGESHCYGTNGANELCRDAYDCNGGACIALTSGGSNGVCVPGISTCQTLGLIGTCTANLAIATCQLDVRCGDLPGDDFNFCVQFGCSYWNDNPPSTGCQSQLSYALNPQTTCTN